MLKTSYETIIIVKIGENQDMKQMTQRVEMVSCSLEVECVLRGIPCV